MSNRFKTAPVPTGEISSYTSDPYNLSSIYMFGSSSPFTGSGNSIVRPNDDLLIQKGGNRALSVYQRLFFDEHVQSSFSKLVQEVVSRPWYVEEYSAKPGDVAVRDFVAEILEELPLDEIYKGFAEALIVGYSVGEIMWKKTKRGVIPFDIRMRDQRRFVFQESEDSQTGFTMRCLTFNRMFEGVELPARKFIVSRYWSQHNGDPYGSSLGRVLYPLVKFRRRAIESYVLYGDRYATPTVVATAPLSASSAEIDTIYSHISNLSQETALVLPEGYKLDFINPSGTPDVFKSLIDYIDKEISLILCGENEAGQAEAGSRASSQVANVVRVVKAAEMSEAISHTLTRTLVRWIVDLNFGVDVAAPSLTREFRIEESPVTASDLSILIQSGFKPRREWVERHFRIELESEAPDFETKEEEDNTTYNPDKDTDLYNSIFGGDGSEDSEPDDQPSEQPLPEPEAEAEETLPEEPEEDTTDQSVKEEAPEEEEEVTIDQLIEQEIPEENMRKKKEGKTRI